MSSSNFRLPLSASSRGFTLVELLAVIFIIILISAFVTPAATNLLKGNKLTQASQMVSDRLGFARQTALTRNRRVEVRFYQYGDTDVPGESATNPTSGKYRAIQLFEIPDTGSPVPLGKSQSLPNGIIMDSGATLSSLLSTVVSGASLKVSIPRAGTNYNAVVFRFLADGSTSLAASGSWFLTFHNLNDGDALKTPPPNFFTLQIEPLNGHVKNFRPGK